MAQRTRAQHATALADNTAKAIMAGNIRDIVDSMIVRSEGSGAPTGTPDSWQDVYRDTDTGEHYIAKGSPLAWVKDEAPTTDLSAITARLDSVNTPPGGTVPNNGETFENGILYVNNSGNGIVVPDPASDANMLAAGFTHADLTNPVQVNEVVFSNGALAGPAPAGAEFGIDQDSGATYYVDGSGDWQPNVVNTYDKITGAALFDKSTPFDATKLSVLTAKTLVRAIHGDHLGTGDTYIKEEVGDSILPSGTISPATVIKDFPVDGQDTTGLWARWHHTGEDGNQSVMMWVIDDTNAGNPMRGQVWHNRQWGGFGWMGWTKFDDTEQSADTAAKLATLIKPTGSTVEDGGFHFANGQLYVNNSGTDNVVPDPDVDAALLAADFSHADLSNPVQIDNIIISNTDLTGAAPAGAEWGYNQAAGNAFYVDGVGDWKPINQTRQNYRGDFTTLDQVNASITDGQPGDHAYIEVQHAAVAQFPESNVTIYTASTTNDWFKFPSPFRGAFKDLAAINKDITDNGIANGTRYYNIEEDAIYTTTAGVAALQGQDYVGVFQDTADLPDHTGLAGGTFAMVYDNQKELVAYSALAGEFVHTRSPSGLADAVTEPEMTTAINAALTPKADQTALDAHTGDLNVHITPAERTKWDAILQAIGINANDVDLGTFAGVIIQDNRTVKDALQDLETALQGQPGQIDATDIVDRDSKLAGSADDTIIHVADASGDPNITAGWAKYQKIAGAWQLYQSQERLEASILTALDAWRDPAHASYNQAALHSYASLDAWLSEKGYETVTAANQTLETGKAYNVNGNDVNVGVGDQGAVLEIWNPASVQSGGKITFTAPLVDPVTGNNINSWELPAAGVMRFVSDGTRWHFVVGNPQEVMWVDNGDPSLDFHTFGTQFNRARLAGFSSAATVSNAPLAHTTDMSGFVTYTGDGQNGKLIAFIDTHGSQLGLGIWYKNMVNGIWGGWIKQSDDLWIETDNIVGTLSVPLGSKVILGDGKDISLNHLGSTKLEPVRVVPRTTWENCNTIQTSNAGWTVQGQPNDKSSQEVIFVPNHTAQRWECKYIDTTLELNPDDINSWQSGETGLAQGDLRKFDNAGDIEIWGYIGADDTDDGGLSPGADWQNITAQQGESLTVVDSDAAGGVFACLFGKPHAKRYSITGNTPVTLTFPADTGVNVNAWALIANEGSSTVTIDGKVIAAGGGAFVQADPDVGGPVVTVISGGYDVVFPGDNGAIIVSKKNFYYSDETVPDPLTVVGVKGQEFIVARASYVAGSDQATQETGTVTETLYTRDTDGWVATQSTGGGSSEAAGMFLVAAVSDNTEIQGAGNSLFRIQNPSIQVNQGGVASYNSNNGRLTIPASDHARLVEVDFATYGTGNGRFQYQIVDTSNSSIVGVLGIFGSVNNNTKCTYVVPANVAKVLEVRSFSSSHNQKLERGSTIKVTSLGKSVADPNLVTVEDAEVVLIDVDAVNATPYAFSTGERFDQIEANYENLRFDFNASDAGTTSIIPSSFTISPALFRTLTNTAGFVLFNQNGVVVDVAAVGAADTGLTYNQSSGDGPGGGRMQFRVTGIKKRSTVGATEPTLYSAVSGGGIPTAVTDLADIGVVLQDGDEIKLNTEIGTTSAFWNTATGDAVDGIGSHVAGNQITFTQNGTMLRFQGANNNGSRRWLKVVR